MVWSSSKTPTISLEPAAIHTGKVTSGCGLATMVPCIALEKPFTAPFMASALLLLPNSLTKRKHSRDGHLEMLQAPGKTNNTQFYYYRENGRFCHVLNSERFTHFPPFFFSWRTFHNSLIFNILAKTANSVCCPEHLLTTTHIFTRAPPSFY